MWTCSERPKCRPGDQVGVAVQIFLTGVGALSDSKVASKIPSFLSSVKLPAVPAASELSADRTGRQRTAAHH
jgi:hypothetical protein